MAHADGSARTRLNRGAVAALAALLLLYVAAGVDGLDRLPIVHGDEMWNAAPAWTLATQGVYGSDLFAGFYRAEQRTYQFMPVLQLLLAADFALFGIGLLQIRMLSIVVGAIVLLLTYVIGRQVGGIRVGLLAAWILGVHRLASGSLDTGIVLVDLVRQTRYHIVASALGLAALCVFLWARSDRADVSLPPSRRALWPFALCGALAGLAFLSHIYGAFWLPALAVVLVAGHGLDNSRRSLSALCLGFALAIVPWGLYVAGDLAAYMGQMRMYGERFALTDAWFYVDNVLREPRRYFPFGHREIAAIGPGTWMALIAFPLTMLRAVAVARRQRASALSAVVIALLVISGLFAVLLKWKTFSYLLTTLPLAAVVMADGAWALVGRLPPRMARVVVAVALLISAGEAAGALSSRRARAARTTPYDIVMRQIASHVPEDAVVVAPHRYWLGLRERRVRSWLVPLLMTESSSYHAPMPLDAALELIDPDVLVLDDLEFGGYFRGLADPKDPRHWQYQQLQRFLASREVHLVAEIRDESYGRIVIYGLDATP